VKREQQGEAMDEQLVEAGGPTVGQRLRAAREEKGLTLEDIAAQTRIPQRHLESLEEGAWDSLPAPTYSIGFAKNYAAAIGLDRAEIGEQLREEMGGQRFTSTSTETFEPADPARTMPKWLVIGAAVAVVLLIVLMSWLNRRSLEQSDDTPVASAPAAQPAQPQSQQVAAQTATAAQGPVVLTATGPAWIQVTDSGKTLFQGELAQGQSFTVPNDAVAPLLKAGKPESLQIKVGNAIAPPVGPAGKVASKVSLKPADLMAGPVAEAPVTGAPQPTSTNTAG
jgi:cytoskeletal protein RodZ